MDEGRKKGHYLVCPDFGPDGAKLPNYTQVRCLCYTLEHIHEIAIVPPAVQFEIIPLRWHHHGEAYPSLGIPADDAVRDGQEMTRLSFVIGDRITNFINELGLGRLVELSAAETMVWADVLSSEEA